MRNFKNWFKTIRNGVTSWDYYTDWQKIKNNLSEYKEEIEKINAIIHSNDIEKELKKVLVAYPNVIKILPMLVATRGKRLFINHESKEITYDFNDTKSGVDKFITFARETGILDMLKNIKGNLSDFIYGVEVGMDTNARKNRSGKAMEVIVETHLINIGLEKDVSYWKQMDFKKFKDLFGINLETSLKANRRFDFVIKKNNKLFIIETNVYQGGGSKQGSICDNYILRNKILSHFKNVSYVWITDGRGWFPEKDDLEDAFNSIKYLFNLNDLEHGELEKIIK